MPDSKLKDVSIRMGKKRGQRELGDPETVQIVQTKSTV